MLRKANNILKTNTIQQMKNLRKLLVIIIILIGITRNGYSQNLSITETQRDSIYNKIVRGNANAEKVIYLQSALKACDSAKALQVQYIGIQDKQSKTKDDIIANDQAIISSLKESVKLEVKRGRRKGFWGFLKGVGIGIGIGVVATTIL